MKIKPFGKLIILILLVGCVFGAYRFYQAHSSPTGAAGSGPGGIPASIKVEGDQGILGRPLRVGVVTWPGYGGGITANNGFAPNKDCIYWNGHKLLVQFMLMEDVDARAKAFARGGDDGVDIVWSTVDFWANELPGFIKSGVNAKAVMQVDWSRGGDAIVVDDSIHRIEDLKGKKISLASFTPSQWLLEYSMENSSLNPSDQAAIYKSLVGTNGSDVARENFVAGKVDACVCWEPDVTEALQKRPGSHILVSSKTAANLIADVMVAREDFIQQHPDVIKAFVQGWMEGTTEANRHPETAAQLLMENEPVYKALGEDETMKGLSTVKWATLEDNTKMFGLDGSEPLFDRLFTQAGKAWVMRGIIDNQVSPSVAKDTTALKDVYAALSPDVRPVAQKEEFPVKSPPPAAARTAPAVMSRPVNIYFESGRAALDSSARQVLDSVATMSQAFSNAYVRVEGNTDNVGNPEGNQSLSQSRAQAVVSYLVAKYGFDRNRFIALGNGPNKPLASNSTATGRSKNRRTDIQIVTR